MSKLGKDLREIKEFDEKTQAALNSESHIRPIDQIQIDQKETPVEVPPQQKRQEVPSGTKLQLKPKQVISLAKTEE